MGLRHFEILNILKILFLKILFVDNVDKTFEEFRFRDTVALQEQLEVFPHLVVFDFFDPQGFLFFEVVSDYDFILKQVIFDKLGSEFVILADDFGPLYLQCFTIFFL